MNKLILNSILILTAVFSIFDQIGSAQVLQTLSGLAVSVDTGNQKLFILFEHPVTGEESLKEFVVLTSTGFKNVKRLDQIQPNDPINIDYEELAAGTLKAVYIEVVSLRKLPFTKEQVRKKIGFLR